MEEIKISYNHYPVLAIMLIAFFLFVILLTSPQEHSIGRIFTLIALFISIAYMYKKLMNDKPIIIINEEGLTNYTLNLKGITFKWSDIVDIKVETTPTSLYTIQRSVNIYVNNIEQYVKLSGLGVRISYYMTFKLFKQTPFSIPFMEIENSKKSVELIMKYYNFYSNKS